MADLRNVRSGLAFVGPALVLALLALGACGGTPLETGGTPCPCKEGFQCVNSVCRPDCKSGNCPGDTQCVSVEGADLAVCLPPGESLGVPMEWPKLPVPVDLLFSIEDSSCFVGPRNELANRFVEFVDSLGGDAQVALRITVTSSEVAGFRSEPAQATPVGCREERTRECMADGDCEDELGDSRWRCSAFPGDQTTNSNGSINSSCYFECKVDADCFGEFCSADEYVSDRACGWDLCAVGVQRNCASLCSQTASWCLEPPASTGCPVSMGPILEGESLSMFSCLAVPAPVSGGIDQSLRHLWDALNPSGPNAQMAGQFLRPEADLAVVFLAKEEDCSIDPGFASPNYTCTEDKDCPGWKTGASNCKVDSYFSQLSGKQIKLCHGVIKKDYYNSCSLLGEYQGLEHHNCAYDEDCKDCLANADCQEWWACGDKGKCRPDIFGQAKFASFQNPPGRPIFALAPVAPFREKLLSLKKVPEKVFVAAIAGDGLTLPPDKDGAEIPSLISQVCLEHEKLVACQNYKEASINGEPKCVLDPTAVGCESYRTAKLACVRECYVASHGAFSSPIVGGDIYISYTDEFGKAYLSLRLIRFAELFGPAGAVYNLNAPGGIRAALLDIADRLNKRIYRACLPDGYSPDVTVLLLRHLPGGDRGAADGASAESTADVTGAGVDAGSQSTASYPGELLTQGPDGDYEILPSWYACCPEGEPDCANPGPAIQFHAMVKAGTTFEVVYVQ